MKLLFLCILLVLASCSSGPAEFSKPPKDAPEWALNPGHVQGTNDLIHEPVWSLNNAR